jgi:hypothetical protein
MLSLEPATVSSRRYPELFQQGETAYGRPIVDGQHPHDLFMELAALYDHQLSEKTLVSVYAAPVGDPAFGPPAYPHRISASENPAAPLGHHFEDSTHIASDVITLGVPTTMSDWKHRFHGREPEDRWKTTRQDRLLVRAADRNPAELSFQYSFAQLRSPEALFDEDIRRMTASSANRPPAAATGLRCRCGVGTRAFRTGMSGTLISSSPRWFLTRNHAWMRIGVDRTNESAIGRKSCRRVSERYFTREQAT